MATLDAREAEICDWLGNQRETMIDLLAEVVNIDSGSYNKAGVDAVGERFVAFFAEHDIATHTVEHPVFGDALRAVVGNDRVTPALALMMGHRDTVFPAGEAARRPFTISGTRAYGPGVADMKGGLVMNAFVLAAFQRFNRLSAPLVGLFTSDEEIASPSSRPIIEAQARKARWVLNSEPGRVSGNVVTGRKGGAFMRLKVFGKAAHSGANFKDGASAIGELASKITALHALTDFSAGTTVNVGLVRGGQSVNTTAPEAEAEIDLRFVTPKDRTEVMARIDRIVAVNSVPGTHASLDVLGEFLPLVPNEGCADLFQRYQQAAAAVGIALDAEFTGACADSGFAAGVGTPTLCALGPVGGKAHTPDEYIELDSLVTRAQAAAVTIARLDRAG